MREVVDTTRSYGITITITGLTILIVSIILFIFIPKWRLVIRIFLVIAVLYLILGLMMTYIGKLGVKMIACDCDVVIKTQ